MNKYSDKHKKIVKQRILSACITLTILALLSVGIYYGAQVILMKYKEKQPAAPSYEAAEVSEEKAPDRPYEEAEDEWYISDAEAVDDDYEDISESGNETVSAPLISKEDQMTDSILDKMSLDEKIAQLFIITPEALTGVDTVTAAGEATKDALKKYPVGGLIYFKSNISEPGQVKKMLKNTQDYAKELSPLPIFLCVDEEGGDVARIAGNEKFDIAAIPSMYEISLSENAMDEAYNTGNEIGSYLKEYGFNVDFAPVADIVTSSENSAIGTRSFGSDPEEVSKLAWQLATGLEDNGIIACFKHFPGLGQSEQDTHTGSASLRKTLSELEENELIPFENAVISGTNMIMVGHISVPLVSGDDMPSSLSPELITGILREQMSYDGLIITDSLMMQAVTDSYDSGQAAKLALKAGADLLLMPQDFESALNTVTEAVKSGEIKEERIDDSLRRIIRIKLKL